MEQSSNSESRHLDKLSKTNYYNAKDGSCEGESRGNVSSLTCYPYIMMPHMIWGAAGVLASPFSVPMAVAAYKAFKKGDMDRAWALQSRMTNERPLLTMPAIASMVPGANVISSTIGYHKAKTSMVLGIEMGPPAPPYAPANKAEIENIKKNIEEFKPLEP
jgi:dihydrodipicolinate synthase/N-acetylneuraminate lyase